jgi:TldD protein
MYEELLKKLEKKVKYADIRKQRYRISDLVMKNGVVSGVSYTEEEGIAIRVLDHGIGYVTTNKLDSSYVAELADKAVKFASSINRDHLKFSEEPVSKEKWSVEENIKIKDLSNEDKLQYLKDVESEMVSLQVPMRIQSIRDKIVETEYINTEGTTISSILPSVSYFCMIGVMENGNFEQSSIEHGRTGGYEAWKEWNILDRVKDEINILKKVAKSKKIPEGKVDLVAGPEVAGIVAHESGGHPSESDRIFGREAAQAGESFIRPDMIGERVGSDIVNVVDDPTFEHSYGYYKYDDEGVKARKRYLYKNGKINEFLTNREYAARLGTNSNAAARSSWWDQEPIVRMSTTYIEPGEHSVEELIEDIKYGVYMNSFTEWNIDDIRFNEKYIGREAYLIENGEVKETIKRPVLEITTTGFYGAIDAISKDFKLFAGTCGKGDPMQGVDVLMGGPHLRLRNVYLR